MISENHIIKTPTVIVETNTCTTWGKVIIKGTVYKSANIVTQVTYIDIDYMYVYSISDLNSI